jgi:biopolymer transport protein ExbD
MAISDPIPGPAPVTALAGHFPSLAPLVAPPKRRHFTLLRTADPHAPIAEINTTPLVDVMLVLLIMFIITIPIASHKVPLDLPTVDNRVMPAPPLFHQLDIAASGALSWNGVALPAEQLPSRLLQLAADPATPELRLHADSEARYERIDQVLAQIRIAGVRRLGFIDNERYAAAF